MDIDLTMPMDLDLTTREVSVLLWSGAALVWAVTRRGVAHHIPRLLATAVPLAWVWLSLSVYVFCLVVSLEAIGLWDVALLKETAVWFAFSAVAYPMQFAMAGTSTRVLPTVARDSISALILIEVLVDSYTFSLPAELLLVPAMTLISLMAAIGGTKEEHQQVTKLMRSLQGFVGLALAALAVHAAATDPAFSLARVLHQVLLPVILTFSTLPFIYWLRFVFAYDEMFRRVGWKAKAPRWFRHYAAARIMLYLRLRPAGVRPFLHRNGMDLHRIADRPALDTMFAADRNVVHGHQSTGNPSPA